MAATGSHAEPRPLNLDPGLLTLGKFMLATTKDQGHRIYLRDGIFAEVTLHYQAGTWEPWPWPDPERRALAVAGRDLITRRKTAVIRPRRTCQAGSTLAAMDYYVYLFTDADTGELRVLPAEYYGPLPVVAEGLPREE